MSDLPACALVLAVCAISAPDWLASVFRLGALVCLVVHVRRARSGGH